MANDARPGHVPERNRTASRVQFLSQAEPEALESGQNMSRGPLVKFHRGELPQGHSALLRQLSYSISRSRLSLGRSPDRGTRDHDSPAPLGRNGLEKERGRPVAGEGEIGVRGERASFPSHGRKSAESPGVSASLDRLVVPHEPLIVGWRQDGHRLPIQNSLLLGPRRFGMALDRQRIQIFPAETEPRRYVVRFRAQVSSRIRIRAGPIQKGSSPLVPAHGRSGRSGPHQQKKKTGIRTEIRQRKKRSDFALGDRTRYRLSAQGDPVGENPCGIRRKNPGQRRREN